MSADVNDADTGLSTPFLFALTIEVDDFHREWSRCSLLANYVGEYIAYQFTQRERAENVISTITNEFLESVIALAPSTSRLSLSYNQTSGNLQLEAKHHVYVGVSRAYLDFLAGLNPEWIRQQYLELLVAGEQPADAFNQLGLMMLTHDFGVHFSVQDIEESGRLKTQLSIPIEALIA
jgi:hypothetical protein